MNYGKISYKEQGLDNHKEIIKKHKRLVQTARNGSGPCHFKELQEYRKK